MVHQLDGEPAVRSGAFRMERYVPWNLAGSKGEWTNPGTFVPPWRWVDEGGGWVYGVCLGPSQIWVLKPRRGQLRSLEHECDGEGMRRGAQMCVVAQWVLTGPHIRRPGSPVVGTEDEDRIVVKAVGVHRLDETDARVKWARRSSRCEFWASTTEPTTSSISAM